MDSFYTIVLSVAIIILIALLTYVGIQITDKKNSLSHYPNSSRECPDYWQVGSDGKSCIIPNSKAKNVGSIYNENGTLLLNSPGQSTTKGLSSDRSAINFSDSSWTSGGEGVTCGVKTWANKYGIEFDGISNYNGC